MYTAVDFVNQLGYGFFGVPLGCEVSSDFAWKGDEDLGMLASAQYWFYAWYYLLAFFAAHLAVRETF